MIELFSSLRSPRINFFEDIVENGEYSIFGEHQLKLYVELFQFLYFETEGNDCLCLSDCLYFNKKNVGRTNFGSLVFDLLKT